VRLSAAATFDPDQRDRGHLAGALDGLNVPEKGFVIRGGRELEDHILPKTATSMGARSNGISIVRAKKPGSLRAGCPSKWRKGPPMALSLEGASRSSPHCAGGA